MLTSKKRKKHQRALNHLLKVMNNNIKNDPLWKGRYCVRQVAAQWYEYEDKSGAELQVRLRFYDKKTNNTYDVANTVNHWYSFNSYHLFMEMNQFIIGSGVWQEEPYPTYANTPDYRNVKVSD